MNPFNLEIAVSRKYTRKHKSIHKIYGADIYGMDKSKSRKPLQQIIASHIQISTQYRVINLYITPNIITGRSELEKHSRKYSKFWTEIKYQVRESQEQSRKQMKARSQREEKPTIELEALIELGKTHSFLPLKQNSEARE